MADRPPSLQDLAFEWFVGEAQDILTQTTELRDELAALRQQQKQDGAAQVAALEAQHKAAVAAQREVVRAVKDGSQSIAQAADQAGRDAQAVAGQVSRRLAAVALLSAAIGAAIGAAGILALFMTLGLSV